VIGNLPHAAGHYLSIQYVKPPNRDYMCRWLVCRTTRTLQNGPKSKPVYLFVK